MERLGSGRLLTVCVLIFAVALLPFIAGCGGGDTEPLFNITGNWDVFTTTQGTIAEQGPNLFSFATSTNTLTGTTSQGQPINGTVSNLNVSFSWFGSDGASNSYTGVVSANGTTMAGTWTSSNGQSGTWNAIIISTPSRSFPPIVNIAGNWNAFLTTDGTSGEQGPEVVAFTQSGNGVGGTTQDRQITGSIMSSSITSILFFWNDGTTNFAFTGIVSTGGNSMSGTWTETGGHSGTWRATRS